nr:ABC transporter ATP-binding protein [uncultured Agathobacter sp.]
MENKIISFEGVTRVYGKGDNLSKAVDNVSFSINKGEFVVILGQSGAGKSTVLNMLGGIDTASEGKIIVAGKDITSMKESELEEYRARKVGFIFQFYNLLTGLTAYENVALSKSISSKAVSPEEMLEAVGLKDKANSFPSQLSGGQQQRVSIARALAKNPDIILGDEPTGALDSETGKKVLELLVNICRKENKTLIIVTHNTAIAQCADTVIHMKNSKIENIEKNTNVKSVGEVEL